MATTKADVRAIWALGDYHRFATATVWSLGPVLVRACGIAGGQRVLDVAAGTGNVALRAAETGATVVASDVTPEHFESGRRAAHDLGVDLEWIEADAESLPFDDASFDAVTSCFGAIFAPDHHAVARELLRVCRPGGVVGMLNFTAAGAAGAFFQLLSGYMPPPPPDAPSPLQWGNADYVRALFREARSVAVTPGQYDETSPSARQYYELFRDTFGPIVAIRRGLSAEPAHLAKFEREFLAYVERWNRGLPGEPIRIPYDYVLVIVRR
jgi:ubiquinone/menaquinone biosynthesis C-methylase UbiE